MKRRDRSSLGTVPGQTANAAVPAALAQMHQAAETIGSAAAASLPPDSAPDTKAAKASFSFVPLPGPVAAGATFRLPVLLSGAVDVATIPLQIQYDPAKISLVNVDSGDFLGKDGQAVALVHRDDGPGDIKITSSRPPGASGVSGVGVVCILTFQAKATGESAVVITRPGAINSAQKQLPTQGARLSIQVK
jgi:general secretion pathway protein D